MPTNVTDPQLNPGESGVSFRRAWRNWANALIAVGPDTVVGWQRKGFRLFWRLISRAKLVGRPRIPREVREQARPVAAKPEEVRH